MKQNMFANWIVDNCRASGMIQDAHQYNLINTENNVQHSIDSSMRLINYCFSVVASYPVGIDIDTLRIHDDNSARWLQLKQHAEYKKDSIIPELQIISKHTQARIDSMIKSQLFVANQVKSHADVVDIKCGKKYIPLDTVSVPVFRKVRNEKKRPTDLLSFYEKKTEWHKKSKSPIDNQSELLSLATSDAMIHLLESTDYKTACFDDIAIGIDFNHVSDNVKCCNKAVSQAITDLSLKWNRKKRPQAEKGFSAVYADGKEIDALSLLSVNNNTGNTFHKDAAKLLKGDNAKVFELYLMGYKQAEIAAAMKKSERTIDSLWARIKTALIPIASELADEIRRQNALPSYAW